MGRKPCCSKEGMNRGAWTAIEDKILTDYITIHGEGRWRNLPQKAGLKRCGKSCRLRWLNYLRPDIKRGNISPDEEELIIRLHKLLGNRWSLIAGRLPGRTDNEIKNYWNTNLGKKVRHHHQNNDHNPSEITTKPGPGSPPPSQVVRTKAVKCTKVMLSHLGHSSDGQYCDNNNNLADKDSRSIMPRHSGENNSEGSLDISDRDNQVVSGVLSTETTPSAADFVITFDPDDELFLADLLTDYVNNDFTNCYGNVLVSSSTTTPKNDHDHLLFSEESTVPDWTSNSDVDAALKERENVGPELRSLSSLIIDGDSEGDWLAAD